MKPNRLIGAAENINVEPAVGPMEKIPEIRYCGGRKIGRWCCCYVSLSGRCLKLHRTTVAALAFTPPAATRRPRGSTFWRQFPPPSWCVDAVGFVGERD